jgi:hypothetical protein
MVIATNKLNNKNRFTTKPLKSIAALNKATRTWFTEQNPP